MEYLLLLNKKVLSGHIGELLIISGWNGYKEAVNILKYFINLISSLRIFANLD